MAEKRQYFVSKIFSFGILQVLPVMFFYLPWLLLVERLRRMILRQRGDNVKKSQKYTSIEHFGAKQKLVATCNMLHCNMLQHTSLPAAFLSSRISYSRLPCAIFRNSVTTRSREKHVYVKSAMWVVVQYRTMEISKLSLAIIDGRELSAFRAFKRIFRKCFENCKTSAAPTMHNKKMTMCVHAQAIIEL